MPRKPNSTRKTFLAARAFSRRSLLKSGLAAGSLALTGCQTTSGRGGARQLNIAIWSGYLTDTFRDDFHRETGIEIITKKYGNNNQLLSMVRRDDEGAFDLISPTLDRAPLWETQGLLQPINTARIDSSSILAPLLAQSQKLWTWDGDLYHLPMMWGTEALAWRNDKWSRDPAELSYGDLWLPEMKGKVQGRPHSLLLGIGLYLDRTGEVPSNRMLDGYRDPSEMTRIWTAITEFASDHRFWINQFWNGSRSQVRGFTHAGCVIGQAWDGPIIRMKNDGKPMTYMAPQEGALAWMDGLSIPADAKNLEEIYAFLDYLYRPEIGGRLASASGYNPAQTGALEFISAANRRAYQESLPGDALDKLWFWPPTPDWYRQIRAEFVDDYLEAVAIDPAAA